MTERVPKQSLSAEWVRAHFKYNASTGSLVWVCGKNAGKEVGYLLDGYRVVSIKRELFRVHRLIWLYVHGHWPSQLIDHENGIGADNRLCNLRECTHQQNMANRRPQNGRHLKGVSRHRNKWAAQIRTNGRSVHLGLFATAEEANAAYMAKAKEINGEFAWRASEPLRNTA